jgi:calcineurin-like phosphoesterase family protein
MSKRLFTADTHLGHTLMARIRGFASVDEHDNAIIANWNREVGTSDQVIVAGDAVMGIRRLTLPLFRQMNGRKFLIAGNHDDCWPGHSNALSRMRPYLEVFEAVQPFMRLTVEGQTVLVSHFPYHADRNDQPRYTQYRLRDEGNWLLHGHTHSTTRRTSAREIHIGMDAWGLTPVSEARIAGMMRAQLAREEGAHATPAASGDIPGAAATGNVPEEPVTEN